MQDFDWENNVTNREEKEKVAKKIVDKVKNNQIIGFGSGTTSYIAVKMISEKIKKEKIKIKAIPTSNIIKELCDKLEIQTTTLEKNKPDWCFDGADEVDKNNNLIKGMGAALYKEKMNILNSNENYILVDNTKFVNKLGEKHPIPVECDKNKKEKVEEELKELGATKIQIRKLNNSEEILITDNNKIILDAWFNNIENELEEKIRNINGVLESGLFIGYNITILS